MPTLCAELIENKPYNKSVDVYAFGVLMWEVLSGEIPYYMTDIAEIRQKVTNGQRPRIPSYGFTPRLVQLITACWSVLLFAIFLVFYLYGVV